MQQVSNNSWRIDVFSLSSMVSANTRILFAKPSAALRHTPARVSTAFFVYAVTASSLSAMLEHCASSWRLTDNFRTSNTTTTSSLGHASVVGATPDALHVPLKSADNGEPAPLAMTGDRPDNSANGERIPPPELEA